MRTRLIASAIGVLLAFVLPGVAQASTTAGTASSPIVELGYPVSPVHSLKAVPIGFATTAAQAVAVAEHTPAMQRLHRRLHPLHYVPYVWHLGSLYWYITFAYHGHVVAEVNVSSTGAPEGVWTGPQAIAPYAHGNYSPTFDKWWVLVPFSVLFMLPFVNLRSWRRLNALDGAAVLSFLVSYLLFDHAHLQTSVWVAYAPLVYLLGRMLWLGFRPAAGPARIGSLLPNRVLVVGLLALIGARVALALLSHQEIDVGVASVVGASRIQHGLPLYFADPGHGDTYGPITYLAYLPFELLFPWRGTLSHLWAADAAALTFDLATLALLVLLGRRLRRGAAGTRLGLVLAWAWAACPFTLLPLIVHTNDGFIGLLSVATLLVVASPAARGAMLGLATAAKFSPAALLPLFAAPRRGRRGAAVCVAAFAVVVAGSIALYLPPGGISQFYDRTLGYQMSRADVFSPWALHPGLHPLQIVIEVLAVALAALVAFVPKERSTAQVCALAAAVTIAVQLPAMHWFYYYIVWFLPFVLVAVLVPKAGVRPARRPAQATSAEHEPTAPDAREPLLAGV